MKHKEQRKANEFGKFQFRTRLFFDSIAILLAWFVSYYLRFFVLQDGSQESTLMFSMLSLVALFSGIFFLNSSHMYEARLTSQWRKEIGGLFYVSIYVFLTFVVIYYYVFYYKISRMHLLMFGVMLFLFLVLDRYIVNNLFAKMIKTGRFKTNVLLVGNGERLRDYYNTVIESGETSRLKINYQYLGTDNQIKGLRQINAASLAKAVKDSQAQMVVISFSDTDYNREIELVREGMELLQERVFTLPRVPKTYVGNRFSSFHYIPMLEINSFNMTSGRWFIKRAFDLVSCTLAVVILSPLFLLLALLVKLSSPGPVFYKQKRVTIDGKIFTMLKFRSMRIDMKEKGGAHWTEENDPRVTAIGKFLRRTSLDEIPQFFNVIQGSMSLIGPRPERPELEEIFEKEIPGYNMRHRMKAGISGWAQVNGLRGNTSLVKRIEYDLYYIKNWSFAFDLRIVFLTFFKGFINRNAY